MFLRIAFAVRSLTHFHEPGDGNGFPIGGLELNRPPHFVLRFGGWGNKDCFHDPT